MQVVVEIYNGVVSDISADVACEVLVIDRDESADQRLADGHRGWITEWSVPPEPEAVHDRLVVAALLPINPT